MTYQEAISRGYIKIVTKPLASQSEAEAVASHKKRGGADVVVVRSIVDGKSGGWIPMSKGGLDGAEMSSLRDRIALAAVKRELGSGDEQEIREAYKAMGQELAEDRGGWGGIIALSQYGHMLKDGFKSIQEAERYVVNYYSSRMNLLRQ